MADSAQPPVVLVDHLSKSYGARRAVIDVSFDMRHGEVMGLLGPNGSGKSTIMRILTGYLRPSSGRAEICGFDVVAQSLQARQCVGYVAEDVPLYAQMRVHEFLTFMGRLRGLDGTGCARAIDEVIERLSIGSHRSQLIGKLSRGYRQRVAIAQALLGRPKLLILDEPSLGLAPKIVREIFAILELMNRQLGLTVLVVEQNAALALRSCSRACVLEVGRVVIEGESAALREHESIRRSYLGY